MSPTEVKLPQPSTFRTPFKESSGCKQTGTRIKSKLMRANGNGCLSNEVEAVERRISCRLKDGPPDFKAKTSEERTFQPFAGERGAPVVVEVAAAAGVKQIQCEIGIVCEAFEQL